MTILKNDIFTKYDYPYEMPFDPDVGLDAFEQIPKAPFVEDVDDEFKLKSCYNRNVKLMRSNIDIPYTQVQLEEFQKCAENPLYFIVNYCKIVTLDRGMQNFGLFQYQKNMIKVMHENRFSIFKLGRQLGKCITKDTNIHARFVDTDEVNDFDVTIAQLYDFTDKERTVEDYVANYEYEVLTDDGFKDFDGVTTNVVNELLEIELSTGKVIRCTKEHPLYTTKTEMIKAEKLTIGDTLYSITNAETDGISVIGIKTIYGEFNVCDLLDVKDTNSFLIENVKISNCLYIDEFAFIPNDVEFYTSTYPVITAGNTTKVILTSTPRGMNLFYKIWTEAESGVNQFKPYHVKWYEHPERDDVWFKQQTDNLSEQQVNQEFHCVHKDTMININGKDIKVGQYYKTLYTNGVK